VVKPSHALTTPDLVEAWTILFFFSTSGSQFFLLAEFSISETLYHDHFFHVSCLMSHLEKGILLRLTLRRVLPLILGYSSYVAVLFHSIGLSTRYPLIMIRHDGRISAGTQRSGTLRLPQTKSTIRCQETSVTCDKL